VGVVVFSHQTFVVFNFHAYCDIKSIDQALSSTQYQELGWPGTYIGQGLVTTKEYLFGCSDRPQVPKALVVVAAGTSVDNVVSPATSVSYSGVEIFCVGVGSQYSE